MSIQNEKPSPEAKALSLFLMAFKGSKPAIKEQAKRINKQWDRVRDGKLTKSEYLSEVQTMLDAHGGYEKVVENTVWHFVKKTGEWTLKGDDKYCQDAQKIADVILKKK